jgi:polyphosphate kinase 2 (PPK2 family)
MNVYHKVLTKIYEVSGGKESVDVDLVELLKKEGFYSNIDNISKQLEDEGWIAEAGRRYTVRITHWGNMEARRVLAAAPDKATELQKESTKLLNSGRELVLMLEEFESRPDAGKLANIRKAIEGLNQRIGKISDLL